MRIITKFAILVAVVVMVCGNAAFALTTMGQSSLAVDSSSVIVQSGKVGVGTPTPQYALDVRGDFVVMTNSSGTGNVHTTMNYVVGSTVDWSLAQYQQVTVGNGGASVSFKNPSGPCGLLLLIKRTGSGVIAFPTVLWQNATAPDLSHSEEAGGNLITPVYDILGLYYDGVNYYGEVNLDFK
ncbi:hypothetical protein EBR57_02905 [bacterium]|nr:hypothetical protein [bacterium]